jgi:hypothetical protein
MRTNSAFLLLLVFLSGCSQKVVSSRTIHINANGFTGEALIACTGQSDKDLTITLDAEGLANAPCPSENSKIYLEQDGKTTRASNFFWTKSGEGVPDSVSIDVQGHTARGY